MDTARTDQPAKDEVLLKPEDDQSSAATAQNTTADPNNPSPNADDHKPAKKSPSQKKKKTSKCKKYVSVKSKKAARRKAKAKRDSSDSSDSSSDSSDDSDSDDDDDDDDDDKDAAGTSSSEEEDRKKRKERKKKKAAKRALKAKKQKRPSKRRNSSDDSSDDSSDSSSSDSDSDSSDSDSDLDDKRSRRRKKNKKNNKRRRASETDGTATDASLDSPDPEEPNPFAASMAALEAQFAAQINALKISMLSQQAASGTAKKSRDAPADSGKSKKRSKKQHKSSSSSSGGSSGKKKGKKGSTLEFKRVDQLWDTTIHNYKLTESAEDQVDEFDEYVFTVRRKFDWENKYRNTVVDIKSKVLRDALKEIMKEVKSVSLVEDEPCIDPNMLFLYLEEMRVHRKKTLKPRLKKEKKKKLKRRLKMQISHLKVLESYLDEDYADTKKTLYPMLEAGNITFDLLWALFKPNTIAFCATYGSKDDPRCFKVDYANKESSFLKGEWYSIEGRYLEYDGKNFGHGEFEQTVESFKGPRKITSLAVYPLSYHKDPDGMKKTLVERGQKFVTLQGMNYKFLNGLGFQKKKKTVAKVNIKGRVMIDPAIFRRINPNYHISVVRNRAGDDFLSDDEDNSDCSDCCCSDSDDNNSASAPVAPEDGGEGPSLPTDADEEVERFKYTVVKDRDQTYRVVRVPVDANGRALQVERLETLATPSSSDGTSPSDPVPDETPPYTPTSFSPEDLLIASPVVLGFAFSEKLWLELSLNGISEISWNTEAFSSLVLPPAQKSIVKGMVSSHKFHAAQRIDDVVQGKGRGLVFVLHGPPGVGKTLTAEGIAEYLHVPLYSVSAGELGTQSSQLEHELQKIMDIAHSWGAVLLLDEADVFLEKREVHDIHRNALVSIFLRLLEYFQGILFLTTNRVETFDDAFQSRIHMPLRYGELSVKARKEIWRGFVERVREGGMRVAEFGDKELSELARGGLNGRQIKNAVRTAQSLALSENEEFTIDHIKKVLAVTEDFDHDMKGGTGYLDAMRSYT
ncbi:hypothetical protein EJ05DRAFT_497202 [Pseudovirgaria hyperparasitica]|uniref:AAA+ ATPase domain-containing protein n=1 Tax=Pseudovirgaria hyperparasitica TaxID=470096 RepID=A0A6A6WJ11_9PEZI|nr:uncharacterized protein EJ05DRAFT_497202 [Pseudovirgaria hyperparasitica]KAF2762349.1 hypothetical protein EJ05DRAFT_497202 [Pseudovirgaria hyperparasitica]